MSYEFGILAALTAPLVMTFGFIVWDNHWKGSAFALNLFKCTTASVGFLVLTLTTRRDNLFPADLFTSTNVGFLMLSSTIGILIGDWTWLEGLRLLGARRVIVVDSCKPFLATLLGWALLDEQLTAAHFGGLALTVVGVLIVSLEKESPEEETVAEDGSARLGSAGYESRASDNNDDTNQEAEEEAEEDAVSHVSDEESLDKNQQQLTSGVISEDPSTSENCDPNAAVELPTETMRLPCHVARGHEPSSTSGVATVEKRRKARTPSRFRKGYAMAVVNVVFDTYGALLTKEYGEGMTTWEINLIRFGFAGACMLGMSCILHIRERLAMSYKGHGGVRPDATSTFTRKETWYSLPLSMTWRSWLHVSLGVVFVTFFTPALSNYALFQIALALALTLGSIGPLYALPLTWILQKERPTWRASVGACLAVAGIALMSFQGKLDDS